MARKGRRPARWLVVLALLAAAFLSGNPELRQQAGDMLGDLVLGQDRQE